MIRITQNKDCCGCSACKDICPCGAIDFKTDRKGFWYPEVNQDTCVDCGICEKACLYYGIRSEARKPTHCFAAIGTDAQEVKASSSGGVFSLLAKHVLSEKGVVFGAAFDSQWNVRHIAIEFEEDLFRLRGSKYVQSRMDNCHRDVESFLKQGRKVLFSGTGCQVAALNRFLKKDYPNLLTVEVVCHGVPSPLIWHDYLREIRRERSIREIRFRDKMKGWRQYHFYVLFSDNTHLAEPFFDNRYMQGFLYELYLRQSCYHCIVKGGRAGSDIVLGDYWGIEQVLPGWDDDKGVSLVMTYTKKGESALNDISLNFRETLYEQAVSRNHVIEYPVSENKWAAYFWRHYFKGEGISYIVEKVDKRKRPSRLRQILSKARKSVRRLLR